MRLIEDMKKFIKKKKAFTLVELMGVLVIIGVLSAILIPVISNKLKENKEKAYQIQLQNIILSAKNFASDNMFLLPQTDGDKINITLGQLKKSGYTEQNIINPKTKQEISNCLQIEVKNINNNYEYTINPNTIEEVCNEDYSSDVLISGPSKTYITNGELSSYILIISPSNEDQVLSYTFDDSKLSLGNETDAKYSVVGENGIYKIIVKAGIKEDDIYLTFETGAIIDSVGNNIDIPTLAYDKIIVDNTAPVITFTNNGSGWTNNAKTKINVSDEKSGGNSSTYKYIFSNVTSAEPTNSFTVDTEVTHTSGNGQYYLIAKACDNVGNCATKTSDYFNMDTKAPSVPTITLVYADNNQVYNQSWTNRNIKQIQSSSDEGVGGIYYQYSHNNSVWTDMPKDWVINWDGSWTFYVRACDSLGNCSVSAPTYWIGRDTVAPSIASITNSYGSDWKNSASTKNYVLALNATETGSGIDYWAYSYTKDSWNTYANSSSLSYTTTPFTTERNQSVYIKVCDKVGNCNTTGESMIKIDMTSPEISTPTIEPNIYISNQYMRRVCTSITDSISGIPSSPRITYEHSTQGTASEASLKLENGKYCQYFGYDGVTNNILYINIFTTDTAGNTSTKSCACYYSNNTCSC